MMEMTDVLEKLKALKPDGYYVRRDGVRIPKYEQFFKLMMEHRILSSSGIARTEEEFITKMTKRVNRVKRSLKRLKEYGNIKKKIKVLDLAAGLGIESLILSHYLKAHVTAVDRTIRFLAHHNKNKIRCWLKHTYDSLGWECPDSASLEELYTQKRVKWVRSKAEDLCVEDNSIDLVFTLYAIEHFNDVDKAFKEMYRVLKPGGVLYAQWSNFYSLEGCHDEGLVDIPWAHVLLPQDEYSDYVYGYRKDLDEESIDLNIQRLTLIEWEKIVSSLNWEMLFRENISCIENNLIPAFVIENKLDNVSVEDLMVDGLVVILRKPH